MKNKIGFILIEPQLGENIGAAARILKNFGFKKLLITSPRDNWPNQKAKATSVGAIDILNRTKIFDRTEDAITNFNLIFSFSSRKRDINKKYLNFDQFLKKISLNKHKKIGLMFGPESSGLSNFDISFCNYIVNIPSVSTFKSLNLSHAIAIVCYEISKLFKSSKKNYNKIKKSSTMKKEMLQFLYLLKKLLNEKDFFKPEEKKYSMIKNINNLFYRLEPNNKEMRILASIISSLSKK